LCDLGPAEVSPPIQPGGEKSTALAKRYVKDPIDFAMVRSINEIGHIMGKQTIAEFVDSKSVLQKLREIGVDFVQGYAISMPEPVGNLVRAN
jgi:EAL domain-containing protein (putative c-di-GMP-specific phosphodiesterase class I)